MQADRQTDMMKPTVTFHNFANTPENKDICVIFGLEPLVHWA
jgi:hypothetical protein